MKKKFRRLSRANVTLDGASTRYSMRSDEAQTRRTVRNQRSIRRLRGSVVWEGNLEESRFGRASK